MMCGKAPLKHHTEVSFDTDNYISVDAPSISLNLQISHNFCLCLTDAAFDTRQCESDVTTWLYIRVVWASRCYSSSRRPTPTHANLLRSCPFLAQRIKVRFILFTCSGRPSECNMKTGFSWRTQTHASRPLLGHESAILTITWKFTKWWP